MKLFLFVLPLLLASSGYAFNPTPIRLSVYSEDIQNVGLLCAKGETKTYGLDFGLITATTCKVTGVQLAFMSGAGKLKGVQLGGTSDVVSGVGMQMGLAFSYADKRYYGVQLGGLGNNCSSKRGVSEGAGIEVSLGCNMAQDFDGLQVAALNYAQEHSGAQIGLVNITENYQSKSISLQMGGINRNENLSGMQIGIYNYAERLSGIQLGIVNKAVRARCVQLGLINIISRKAGNTTLTPFPVTTILNASW